MTRTSNGENQNEENEKKPKGVIILGVYVHCEGCADQVHKSLRGFEGVEEIEIDVKKHKVTVKGKEADPIKVAERLKKKSGKHVELIYPKTKKEKKKEEKKPEGKVIEVELKVYIHCEGCAKEIKTCIHKMEGVKTVDPDMGKNRVTVKGTMDPKKLVEFIEKRGGRRAEIVKQQRNKNKRNDDNNNDTSTTTAGAIWDYNNNNNDKKMYNNKYPQELVYAPQLFSDENPNSCSLM